MKTKMDVAKEVSGDDSFEAIAEDFGIDEGAAKSTFRNPNTK